jgi:flagellar biosynthesis repressor protein FlbT
MWLDAGVDFPAADSSMPLKIRIPAGEKFVVNGAVITNVDDRAIHLQLENEAQFMRGRDVLQAEDATTPLDQAYFYAQSMYIEPELRDEQRPLFTEAARRAFLSATDDTVRAVIFDAVGDVGEGRFFAALSKFRELRKTK